VEVLLLKRDNKSSLTEKFETLGPEPLEDSFDWKSYKSRLSRKQNQKIKTVLMDQSLIVGIGNIYSDEILWASKIHPERTILKITDSEYKLLYKHTNNILK
jgi:formamidopyrimidine-DNA glycosylase